MTNFQDRFTDEQLAEMRAMYEGYTATWVIAEEFGFANDKSFRGFANRQGWRRPADFCKKLAEVNTFQLNAKKEAYLRTAWHDGALMAEIEAELGVAAKTIRRLADDLELGPRDKKAIIDTRRERNGITEKTETAQRLWNHSDLTPDEIASEVGISRLGLLGMARRRRQAGDDFKRRMPRYKVTAEDRSILRDGYQLGLNVRTIGRLLSNDERIIQATTVDRWGRLMGLKHRNHWPQMLRLLSPDQLWAFRQCTGEDPCVLVQKAYTISNEMSLLLARRCIIDYHKALVRFPEIMDVMVGVKNLFWQRRIKPVREPHPMIERMRTQHVVRKAAA